MKKIRLNKKSVPIMLQKKIDGSLVYVCPYCDNEFPVKLSPKRCDRCGQKFEESSIKKAGG